MNLFPPSFLGIRRTLINSMRSRSDLFPKVCTPSAHLLLKNLPPSRKPFSRKLPPSMSLLIFVTVVEVLFLVLLPVEVPFPELLPV